MSLMKADMGVAMQSGSAATRAVADMILLDDSFGALPHAFTEGQRIANGMKDILRLFLTRVMYSALLIVAIALIGLGFPFLPKQNTLIVFFTVGLPVFALALWARPGPLRSGRILREVAHFVLPAGLIVAGFSLLVYAGAFTIEALNISAFNFTNEMVHDFERYAGLTYDIAGADALRLEMTQLTAQSALASFLVFVGLGLIPFVEPPTRWFVGGRRAERGLAADAAGRWAAGRLSGRADSRTAAAHVRAAAAARDRLSGAGGAGYPVPADASGGVARPLAAALSGDSRRALISRLSSRARNFLRLMRFVNAILALGAYTAEGCALGWPKGRAPVFCREGDVRGGR